MIDIIRIADELRELYQFVQHEASARECEQFSLSRHREQSNVKRLRWTVQVGSRTFSPDETAATPEHAIEYARTMLTNEAQRLLSQMESIKRQLPALTALRPIQIQESKPEPTSRGRKRAT